MYRRKVTTAAAALFAIGVSFAAEPTSEHANRNDQVTQQRAPWVPGKNMLMSAHEASPLILAPPPP